MSFWNTAQPNGFSTRCHTAFADEIYTRDPESGDFARVYPGGSSGGGGDVPYWVKPESASIGDTNKKTTVAFDGLDIIDNVNNTACEITSTALTLGNASGNSILTKETIDAANRVKNIAQEMDQPSKKLLLYDSTSKGITFGNQQIIPGWVQPTAATFSSGDQSSWLESNYFKLGGGLAETFLDTDNLSFKKNSILNFELIRNAAESDEVQLRWMDSVGNLSSKIGSKSIFGKNLVVPGVNGTLIDTTGITSGYIDPAGALITTIGYGKLTRGNLYFKNSTGTQETILSSSYLNLKENGVNNILDKDCIRAANNLASLPLVVPGTISSYNSVIYDPATKNFRYTPIATSVPTWAKTNSIDSITAGSVSISAAKGGFGYLDLDNSLNNSRIRLNGPESSLDIQKTTDGVTENAALTITDVQITNKLKALSRIYTDYNPPSGLSNTIQNDVVYNPVSKNFAYRATERAAMNDASYSQNANGGGLVALYRDGSVGNPHNLLQPDTIVAYSGGETPDMKRFELKNKLLMEFSGNYNMWYCVHFATDVTLEADAGAVKATICPTERVDTGVTGPAILYTCLVNSEIPKRDNVLVPKGSFCFKIYNPSIDNMTSRTTTRILFERVCGDFESLGGVLPTRLARQA